MCRQRWRTSSWFNHGRTSNTNHLCKPFLNLFWWTAPCTSTAQHDSAYNVALTLLWLSIPLFSCSRLPFGGKKKVGTDPFSNLAQDRNEGPEDYQISWAIRWRASCDLFWTGMSHTQFWPSLRGIYAKSSRVQQSLVDTRLVNFLVHRNVFNLLWVEICANFLSLSGRARTSTLSAFAFHVTNLFGFPRMISLQHAADRRYV
jgi:hypothetical protein